MSSTVSRGSASTRVLFLILSHTRPGQVARLVNALAQGREDITVVLHHDYARSYLDPASLPTKGVHLLRHTPRIEWGTFSQVEVVMRSFRWILSNIEFDWIVVVSGQDYPLRPVDEFVSFLGHTEYEAFLEDPIQIGYRFKDASGERDWWSARYFFRYYRLPDVPSWISLGSSAYKAISKVRAWFVTAQPLIFVWPLPRGTGTHIGFRRFASPFSDSFRCYSGSDWYTLSRRCVEIIIDFFAMNRDVINHYRRTILPSESVFHTILFNRNDVRILRDNLLYVRMAPPSYAHPETLRLTDLEALLASGKYVGRKFDESVDPYILEALDRRLASE